MTVQPPGGGKGTATTPSASAWCKAITADSTVAKRWVWVLSYTIRVIVGTGVGAGAGETGKSCLEEG